MKTNQSHVTEIEVAIVVFDGTANCTICDRPISYRTDVHAVPTICNACHQDHAGDGEMMNLGKLTKAGDGWAEIDRPGSEAPKPTRQTVTLSCGCEANWEDCDAEVGDPAWCGNCDADADVLEVHDIL